MNVGEKSSWLVRVYPPIDLSNQVIWFQKTLKGRIYFLPFVLIFLFRDLPGQWLNFKLFGITYLVGKNKVQTFFFRVLWLSEEMFFSVCCCTGAEDFKVETTFCPS